MGNNNITINVNSGQVSLAQDNATIYNEQNNVVTTNKPVYDNGITANELDNIIKSIMDNLSELNKKEDADKVRDIVNMAKKELAEPEPKSDRLRRCVTLIAPMLTIANGIPTLANNLQKLMDYITPYIN